MGLSKNNGTLKSSILIGLSIIFTIHFGVYPYFWKHPNQPIFLPFLGKEFLHGCYSLHGDASHLEAQILQTELRRDVIKRGCQHIKCSKVSRFYRILYIYHLFDDFLILLDSWNLEQIDCGCFDSYSNLIQFVLEKFEAGGGLSVDV